MIEIAIGIYILGTLICGFGFFFMVRNWGYYWQIFKEFMLNAAICLGVGLCWPIVLGAVLIGLPKEIRRWKNG